MGEGNSFEANFPNPLEIIEVKCLDIIFPIIESIILLFKSVFIIVNNIITFVI